MVEGVRVKVRDIEKSHQLEHLEKILKVTAETAEALIEDDEAELGSDLLFKVSETIHTAVEEINK